MDRFEEGWLTHSHTMTSFDVPGEKSLFKTLWEKEKMLESSIFSFSHNVFYTIKDRNYHLCCIYFVVCKCFEFGQGQIFVVWKWINPALDPAYVCLLDIVDQLQTALSIPSDLGRYSPTILKNVLSLVLQISLYLEAFECDTASDWLNHSV